MMTVKQRSWSAQLKWLFALHLALGSVATVKADLPITRLGAIKKPSPGDEIFTNLNVLRIQIEIPSAGLSLLRRFHWGGGGTRRPIARVTVREGDTVYTNVALHLKGAAGSFRPLDWNPAMTLNFEKFSAGQRFHGLKKISLNNSVQDPSFLTEKICRELFEAAGVPVPRAAHAQVGLNGRDLGLYVLVEGFNKQFLKRYFKNTSGNLYDGGFVKEITDDLAINSGDNPKDRSRLDALAEAASDPNPTRRMARLEKVLDMDRFLSLIAMEVMQCHWDGYAMNKNNYRVYHDLDSNRMVFFPHGLDQMFGVERASPNLPLVPRMEGLVAQSVLQMSTGGVRYLERVSQLFTNVFRVEVITNRVYEIAAKIGPVVAERNPQGAVNFAREVTLLCWRIAQRAQSIEQQLGYPTRTLKFDESGIVQPSGWKPRPGFGNPSLAQNKDADGKTILHVSANEGNCGGSWRTRVLLEGGSYRLEGRVKTLGIVADRADRQSGACLRISGGFPGQRLSGDNDWTRIAYVFEIQDAMGDVELVCDFRAAKGEAWFDLESLKLIRL